MLVENNSPTPTPTSTPTCEGIKLPKIDVPSFDGNILHWQTFWDQFCISIHHRTNLSEAEKLVYLQQALKDGSAKHSIEGLSQLGDCYAEAISCLKSRFDQPRLIHQTHVRIILEAPLLITEMGKSYIDFTTQCYNTVEH